MADALPDDLAQRVTALLSSDPGALADPYTTWNELRDNHGVWRSDTALVITRYQDVRDLLGDNNVLYSRAKTRNALMYIHARERFEPAEQIAFDRSLEHEFRQLVRLDPPDHMRERKVVQAPFTVRSLMREMEPKVRARIDDGMDELLAQGEVVDIKRFAYTLPFRVIGDLLGISLTDLDTVHGWARKIADNKFNADSGALAVEAAVAYESLLGYVDVLIEEQRASGEPTGLVATLLEAMDGGHINADEAASLMALMVFAGHETTSSLISVGVMALMEHRDQWSLLCDDPDLAPAAVEELLRFVTPVQFLPYTSVQDRDIGGVPVKAGETVIGSLAAANRDPEVFDRPDELDLTRDDVRNHIGFGLGPHFCLGAGLARMEASMLFRRLAEEFPGAELVPQQVTWGGRSLRTPLKVEMRLGTTR